MIVLWVTNDKQREKYGGVSREIWFDELDVSNEISRSDLYPCWRCPDWQGKRSSTSERIIGTFNRTSTKKYRVIMYGSDLCGVSFFSFSLLSTESIRSVLGRWRKKLDKWGGHFTRSIFIFYVFAFYVFSVCWVIDGLRWSMASTKTYDCGSIE